MMRVIMLAGVLLSLSAGPAAAEVHEVTVINFTFEPPKLTIAAGDTVRWRIISGRHSTTADGHAWTSGELQAGDVFELRFDEPGLYQYFCTPHDFMRGAVKVEPAPRGNVPMWLMVAMGGAGALLLAAGVWQRRCKSASGA